MPEMDCICWLVQRRHPSHQSLEEMISAAAQSYSEITSSPNPRPRFIIIHKQLKLMRLASIGSIKRLASKGFSGSSISQIKSLNQVNWNHGRYNNSCKMIPDQSLTKTATTGFQGRKLLQQQQPPPAIKQSKATFDTDVVIVLGAVLCALICAVWIHSIARCVIRRNRRAAAAAAAAAVGPHGATVDSSNVGLDPKTIDVLPIVPAAHNRRMVEDPGDPLAALSSGNVECIVCLQEFDEGDVMKLLPNCGHGFHVDCIGAWLVSHSSCPICRHGVLEPPSPISDGVNSGSFVAGESSSSFLLSDPMIRQMQRELNTQNFLHFQQRQRWQSEQLQNPSASRVTSTSLYSMFVADRGILQFLDLQSRASNVTTPR